MCPLASLSDKLKHSIKLIISPDPIVSSLRIIFKSCLSINGHDPTAKLSSKGHKYLIMLSYTTLMGKLFELEEQYKVMELLLSRIKHNSNKEKFKH